MEFPQDWSKAKVTPVLKECNMENKKLWDSQLHLNLCEAETIAEDAKAQSVDMSKLIYEG